MKFWGFYYQHWQGFDFSLLVIAIEIRCASVTSCSEIICKPTLLLPSIFVMQACKLSSYFCFCSGNWLFSSCGEIVAEIFDGMFSHVHPGGLLNL